MKKSLSLIAMSLLAGSLTIPSGRVYADENPPGNHKQREELRRDQHGTRKEKFVRTEKLFTDKSVTDGIVTGITITIMTDF